MQGWCLGSQALQPVRGFPSLVGGNPPSLGLRGGGQGNRLQEGGKEGSTRGWGGMLGTGQNGEHRYAGGEPQRCCLKDAQGRKKRVQGRLLTYTRRAKDDGVDWRQESWDVNGSAVHIFISIQNSAVAATCQHGGILSLLLFSIMHLMKRIAVYESICRNKLVCVHKFLCYFSFHLLWSICLQVCSRRILLKMFTINLYSM